MPFLKAFGISLFLTLIAWMFLYWQDWEKKKSEEESPRRRFVRISVLADKIKRGDAATEEEEEYYRVLASLWGKLWFGTRNPKNYEEISERALYLARLPAWSEKISDNFSPNP